MNDIKKNNIKKIILGSFLGILIGSLLGTTYAMFTYERGGTTNSKLIAGDIYMKYKDTNREINLSNAMPSATYEGGDYFEFEITGKNTSNKTIYYELLLNHGGLPTSGTYTETNRIADEFLRFRLVEVTGTTEGNDLLTTTQYYNIDNERIYVGTIPGGGASAEESTTKYRLYCWIDNSLGIGVDYTQEEWNNLFASIGVNVNGDFTEKTLPTRTLITYNANGGKVLPSKKEIKSGQTTYGPLAEPTKDGYTFDGWYSDSELTTKVESTTAISGTLPATLYAKWKEPVRIECPGEGCYYMFTTNTYNYGASGTTRTKIEDEDGVTLSSNYEDVPETRKYFYFLGVKFENNKISRAYACGIENGTPFCIEGYTDGSKQGANIGVLTPIFGNTCEGSEGSDFVCRGSLNAGADSGGLVGVQSSRIQCLVIEEGALTCEAF